MPALVKVYDTTVVPAVPGDPGQVGYTSCPVPPPPPPPPGGSGGGHGGPGGSGSGGDPMGCPAGTTYTCVIVHLPYPVEFCYCNTNG